MYRGLWTPEGHLNATWFLQACWHTCFLDSQRYHRRFQPLEANLMYGNDWTEKGTFRITSAAWSAMMSLWVSSSAWRWVKTFCHTFPKLIAQSTLLWLWVFSLPELAKLLSQFACKLLLSVWLRSFNSQFMVLGFPWRTARLAESAILAKWNQHLSITA